MKQISILLAVSILFLSCTPAMRGKKDQRPVSSVEVNRTGALILEEPVTFDVMVRVPSIKKEKEGSMYPFFEALAEETNVRINWQEMPRSSHVSKLILALASNSYGEAFWNFGLDPRESQLLASQGFIIPLKAYMEEGWAPNLSAILEERPRTLAGLDQDGDIYSLPVIAEMKYEYGDAGVLVINQDWLDRLGLEVPQTLEEFEAVLTAFRDEDANGNGDPDDEIPFGFTMKGNGWVYPWRMLLGSWGLIDDRYLHIMVEKERVVYVPAQDGFREGVRYYSGLYQAGLMDEESYTQDEYVLRSKAKNDVLGCWLDQRLPDREEEPGYAGTYAPVPPLAGPDGKRLWPMIPIHPGLAVQITDKCKSPEALIRFADRLYDPLNSMQVNYGMIGKDLTDNGDGTYTPMLGEEELLNVTIKGGSTYLSKTVLGMLKNNRNMREMNSFMADAVYRPWGPEEHVVPYPVPREITKELNSLQEDLNNYVSEKQASWIFGKADVDEEWDEFLAELDKIGVSRVVEIYQDLRDSYHQ